MPLYVEVWNARPAWLALPVQTRIAFLDRMEESLRAFTRAGARLIGVALTEPTLTAPYGTTYVAVWVLPEGAAQIQRLDEVLEAAGWYEYFERDPDRTPTIELPSLFRYESRRITSNHRPPSTQA